MGEGLFCTRGGCFSNGEKQQKPLGVGGQPPGLFFLNCLSGDGPTFRAAKSSKSRWGAAECSPPVPLASQAACVSGGTRGPPPPACGVALAPPVRRIPLISAFSGRDPPHSRRTFPSTARAPPQPVQARSADRRSLRARKTDRQGWNTLLRRNTTQATEMAGPEGWRGDRKAPPRARRREILARQYHTSNRNGRPRRAAGRSQSPCRRHPSASRPQARNQRVRGRSPRDRQMPTAGLFNEK